MKTTYFKPSIHGWPFDNSYDFDAPVHFDHVTLHNLGYCGGMCWTALDRFYAGINIPRGTQSPAQGDDLYNEILNEQLASLMGPSMVPGTKLWQIYEWQQSPDLDNLINLHHSLGRKTQKEWRKIKKLLDSSKPVTLTLIASSNDYNPDNLKNNHRVVAYAYEERPLQDGEWVHGDSNPNIRHVTIFIYDPNYHDDDDVRLTFHRGCDDSWIRLRHNKPYEEYHGFFLDDKERSYTSADSTSVWIDSIVQTGISSVTEADYDLQFSWKCRFIPYFCIQVNGVNWQNNALAKANYLPADKDNKQCPARTGSETVKLKLPRNLSRVTVRLLDADNYSQSTEVDASPTIVCYPYVRSRGRGQVGQVCDPAITAADLFIKDPNPTQAAIQQLDTSPFRWVMILNPPVTDTRARQDDLSRAVVEVIVSYCLGNVAVPILADFVESNLAVPTQISGVITIKRGQTVQTMNLRTLAIHTQKIFDGFTSNPTDYDNNTEVEFTYTSKDRFGAVARGQAKFYGRSIIYSQNQVTIYAFEPAKVAKHEAVARELLERGLVDLAIELPHRPPESTTDPLVLLQKLRSHRQLQNKIDKLFNALWRNPRIWKKVWKNQSKIINQAEEALVTGRPSDIGYSLKAASEFREAEQRKYDSVVINTFAQTALEQVRRDPTGIKILEKL